MKSSACRLRIVGAFLILLSVCSAACVADQGKMDTAEFAKKMEQLQKQLEECGPSLDCIEKVAKDMEAFTKQWSEGAATTSAQPPSLTCENYNFPGWSCVPVKVTIAHAEHGKHVDFYCDPEGILPCNRVLYESYGVNFNYQAEATGILTYKHDFTEFDLSAKATPESTRIQAFAGFRRNRLKKMGAKIEHHWETQSFPSGPVEVRNPCGIGIYCPMDRPSNSNICYDALEVGMEDEFHPTYSGLDGCGSTDPGESSLVTPEIMREIVATGHFTKKLHFRFEQPGDLPQYTDAVVTMKIEIGQPTDEPGVLSVAPGDGLVSSGPDSNGAFTPSSKTYTVRNTGKSTIGYNVSKGAGWLTLSGATGGILTKGASATVTVAIDAAKAKELKESTYTDTVSFVNTTNGKGNTSRPVTLEVGETQLWRVTTKGFEWTDIKPYTTYKDTDGTTKQVIKAVRFNWDLTGEFMLKKEKKQWVYKHGQVKSVKLDPVVEFQPKGLYSCQFVKCVGKAPITTMIGAPLIGDVFGGSSVKLLWPPRKPSACVSCLTSHPSLPKTPYDAIFDSFDFANQISLETFPLKDGYMQTFKKKDWLRYTVTLKRLK